MGTPSDIFAQDRVEMMLSDIARQRLEAFGKDQYGYFEQAARASVVAHDGVAEDDPTFGARVRNRNVEMQRQFIGGNHPEMMPKYFTAKERNAILSQAFPRTQDGTSNPLEASDLVRNIFSQFQSTRDHEAIAAELGMSKYVGTVFGQIATQYPNVFNAYLAAFKSKGSGDFLDAVLGKGDKDVRTQRAELIADVRKQIESNGVITGMLGADAMLKSDGGLEVNQFLDRLSGVLALLPKEERDDFLSSLDKHHVVIKHNPYALLGQMMYPGELNFSKLGVRGLVKLGAQALFMGRPSDIPARVNVVLPRGDMRENALHAMMDPDTMGYLIGSIVGHRDTLPKLSSMNVGDMVTKKDAASLGFSTINSIKKTGADEFTVNSSDGIGKMTRAELTAFMETRYDIAFRDMYKYGAITNDGRDLVLVHAGKNGGIVGRITDEQLFTAAKPLLTKFSQFKKDLVAPYVNAWKWGLYGLGKVGDATQHVIDKMGKNIEEGLAQDQADALAGKNPNLLMYQSLTNSTISTYQKMAAAYLFDIMWGKDK